jgi:hypothetical protein
VVDKRNCAINAYAVEKAVMDAPAITDKEIALEIIAEIDEALKSNYRARAERIAIPNIDMADEFVSYCDGKIAALRGINDFIESIIGDEND